MTEVHSKNRDELESLVSQWMCDQAEQGEYPLTDMAISAHAVPMAVEELTDEQAELYLSFAKKLEAHGLTHMYQLEWYEFVSSIRSVTENGTIDDILGLRAALKDGGFDEAFAIEQEGQKIGFDKFIATVLEVGSGMLEVRGGY